MWVDIRCVFQSQTKSKSQYFLPFSSDIDVRQCVYVLRYCFPAFDFHFLRVLVKYARSRVGAVI